MLPSGRSRASSGGRTCATTARSWSWTAGSASPGSQNLTEPGYNKPKNHKLGREWVELMTRVEGPVVRQLNLVFVTDWYSETDENLRSTLEPRAGRRRSDRRRGRRGRRPGGAERAGVRDREQPAALQQLLYAAERRLSLTSPYFVPDESLLYAVTTAAQRGVDVELFVSATADQFMVYHAQRSYYDALLEAGVRIWLYPAPYVLHAKHFTVDDYAGRDRVQQHGHALVRPQLRGGPDAHRDRGRRSGSRGPGHLPEPVDRADHGGVAHAHLGREVRRQRDAADRRPAVDLATHRETGAQEVPFRLDLGRVVTAAGASSSRSDARGVCDPTAFSCVPSSHASRKRRVTASDAGSSK